MDYCLRATDPSELPPIGITGLGWIGDLDEHQSRGDGSRAGAAGVMLQPFARGNGDAYEALRIVFDYEIRELGLMEIRVGCQSINLPMRMLMEQFGFETERMAEGTEVDQFGNDLLWVIRRHEWLNLKEQGSN